MNYDAVIIGAGLAGCSTALHLARHGHQVALLEKQRYPVHKLCGEFLSVETQGLFSRLGVLDAVLKAGARPITQVRLTTGGGTTYESGLPGSALGLSRYQLDAILLRHAQNAGVAVWEGLAASDVVGSLDEGFQVTTREKTFGGRVVIGAYGKRGALDRKLNRPFMKERSPYVGFKAHFEGIQLGEWIEMHAFPGGYCGLSPVEAGRTNVCWIGHETTLKQNGGDPSSMLHAMGEANIALQQRLDVLQQVSPSFKAVSQVAFSPKTAWAHDICMVGDTAGMIAPMCGDGMAMALRSAEIASPLLDRFLNGQMPAAGLRNQYERSWGREFGLRMRLGRLLHHAYGRPGVAKFGVSLCRRVPAVGNWFIRHTRG